MIIEVDNSNCEANINVINVSINKTVTMRSGGSATSDGGSIYRKQINGVPAKMSKVVSFYFIFREMMRSEKPSNFHKATI